MKIQDSYKRGSTPTLICAIFTGIVVGTMKVLLKPDVVVYHTKNGGYGLDLFLNVLFILCTLCILFCLIVFFREIVYRIICKRKTKGGHFFRRIEGCSYNQYLCVNFIPYVMVEVICICIAVIFSDMVVFEYAFLSIAVILALVFADLFHVVRLRKPGENEMICDDGLNVVVEKQNKML